MPERPKRRKNNKNRRKNKPLSQTDTSKNNVEPNETSVIESSSNASEQIVDSVDSGHTLIDVEQTHINKDTLTVSNTSIQDDSNDIKSLELKETNDEIEKEKLVDNLISEYIVETPEQATKAKPKLDNSIKSKSCDNDDSPTIVEITDDTAVCTNLPIVESDNIIISSEDSSNVKWEEVDSLHLPATELIKGVLSSDTIPLNIVRCEQIQSLSPEEESSLRTYLKTLNLSTNPSNFSSDIKTELEHLINREVSYRLRKKGFAEDNLYVRAGTSRSLAVIDEEGSGDSSKTSRRHSYLSDKKSDNEELEDDVFESKQIQIDENISKGNKQTSKHLIPQKCIKVDAKIKEPQISEARGDWTLETIEQMTGAELVYLTDSSSSTSSIYDVNEEFSQGEETDVSVRMITPTIEVTDTEKLLSNVYFAENMNSNDVKMSDLNKYDINVQQSDKTEPGIFVQEVDATRIENPHEIVVLSTDNIETNLFVKELEQVENNEKIKNMSKIPETNENIEEIIMNRNPIPKSPEDIDEYDLEIKVLKCELNDAINNLIKEVTSDTENNNGCSKDSFSRQDSSSSLDSSQCTAKYNPNYSSLNDVSNILQDEKSVTVNKIVTDSSSSHVKEVLQSVSSKLPTINKSTKIDPLSLRDICLSKISSFPFGHKILEELAHVSERLQNSVLASQSTQFSKRENLEKHVLQDKTSNNVVFRNKDNHVPPPIKPRRSSLRKKSDEQNKPVITKTEVCLSPSQKMLMEKTNTIVELENIEQKDKPKHNMPVPIIPPPLREDKKIHKNLAIREMPMKSQTGSRLLALLLDSSQSGKLNSSTNVDNNLPTIKTKAEIFSKRAMEEIDSANFSDASTDSRKLSSFKSNNFKPEPPPKPTKLCSYFYESDESSDFRENSFRSMHNNRKYFHFSTGNLNKEIESDISSIQNMHRYYTNLRNNYNGETTPRRPSLPKDLCDKQMEYICRKEKEIDAEIQRLEQERNKVARSKGPRAPMISEKPNSCIKTSESQTSNFSTTQNLTNSERKVSSLFSSSQEELLREKMYSEYVSVMAEREQRKQQKVIKITKTPGDCNISSKSMPTLENLDSKVNNPIEQEFISKARERWQKLGINDPETEDEKEYGTNVYREPKVIEHKIKVIDAGVERDVQKLPSHMQDFVKFTVKNKDDGKDSTAIWRPGAPTQAGGEAPSAESPSAPPPPPPPVWTPNTTSPQTPRKSFRPVHFEDTPPPRRKFGSSDQNGCTSGSESEGRLRTSQSAPATGLNTLGSSTSRLPRAQNPTVTLLQKAREGQIPRGPCNIPPERDPRLPRDRPSPPKGDPVHALRKEYASEGEGDRSDYERSQKMNDSKKKIEGIGPITKDGMPVALRSEVKDPSRWYKKMYDTIHKNKFDEDYVTIRYKNRRGEPQRPSSNRSQYAYFDPRSGYLSEPEGGLRLTSSTWSDAYDSDVATGPRRRTASVQEERRFDDMPYLANNKYSTLASARARQEVYKGQPGRIENYMPGKSSVVDKEAKQWWDEVMDIFDGQNGSVTPSQPQASPKEKKDLTSAILSKSNMARALKESGYESDSTLIFRRRENTEAPLSPAERHAAYRDLQAGGEPPLRGFRSPAPPRQETDSAPEPPRRVSHSSYSDSESPSRRYVESDVNIHYRCPVRHDPLPLVPERELARQQAEHMKRLYREQRRNKYLQENDIRPEEIEAFDASMKELQDMQNRRHQDNFMPSQKTIVPLNRYDEAEKIIAKALYTFNGQTTRELSFRKGDIINVRRQIDSNWYEGEVHGKVGLFPYNYVEILKSDGVQTLKKPTVIEGRARAKFDFIAQTNLELPLKKGEVVVLTRRIDHNWWEGRNGNKTGIFPDSYITILQEPSQSKPESQPILSTPKPAASPAAHGLINGVEARGMSAHRYTPQLNSPALSNAPPADLPLQGYITKSTSSLSASERGYGPPTGAGVDLNNSEPLYVDTNAEAVPYRAMYKYRPQNPDELELNEGDTVYVLEKCDDGWYVGSSQRTGRFGTFPGNYVERI